MTGRIIDIDHPAFAGLGLRMDIHDPEADMPVSSVLSRTGAWEGFLTRQMIALLARLDMPAFYDIGANIGWYSLVLAAEMRRAGRDGRVIAVEPSPGNRARLEASLALNGLEGLVEVVAGAASDRNGALAFLRDPVNHGNHRVSDDAAGAVETVPAHRLDDLVARHGWPLPRLVKADVQGHEMEALRGFLDSLAAAPGWVMALEWIPGEWRLEEMLAMLGADGLYQVDEQSLRIVPTTPSRLLGLQAHWPSGYYDLFLTRGAAAEAAVRGLAAFEDRVQLRFRHGAGPHLQNDRRRVTDGTQAVIEPLRRGLPPLQAVLEIPLLHATRRTRARFRLRGSDGRETLVEAGPGETLRLPVTVGPSPARLGIRLTGGGPDAALVLGPVELHLT